MHNGIFKLAFHTDKLCGTHVLRPVYRSRTFRCETVKPQADSAFMALPTELRLIVYGFVFAPPYDKANNIDSILATCRKVHCEALIMALQTTQFHLDGRNGLNFQPKLRSLSDLQQHLRYINVTMPIQKLDGANNPFTLTKIPLTSLEIDFETIECASDWLRENRLIIASCPRYYVRPC